MEFPILIHWSSPFPFKGLLGGIFHFYSNFNRTVYKLTVDTLNAASNLGVHCSPICPTKRMLGLYGLTSKFLQYTSMYHYLGLEFS